MCDMRVSHGENRDGVLCCVVLSSPQLKRFAVVLVAFSVDFIYCHSFIVTSSIPSVVLAAVLLCTFARCRAARRFSSPFDQCGAAGFRHHSTNVAAPLPSPLPLARRPPQHPRRQHIGHRTRCGNVELVTADVVLVFVKVEANITIAWTARCSEHFEASLLQQEACHDSL